MLSADPLDMERHGKRQRVGIVRCCPSQFYTGWETYQGYLEAAMSPLSEAQLALSLWSCTAMRDHGAAPPIS